MLTIVANTTISNSDFSRDRQGVDPKALLLWTDQSKECAYAWVGSHMIYKCIVFLSCFLYWILAREVRWFSSKLELVKIRLFHLVAARIWLDDLPSLIRIRPFLHEINSSSTSIGKTLSAAMIEGTLSNWSAPWRRHVFYDMSLANLQQVDSS